MKVKEAKELRKAALATRTTLAPRRQDFGALKALLADIFALYLKTKNFHWHVSGPHFRDYHLLLDDQAGQILATTDPIAERVRKLGGTTLRSIGHIARLQRGPRQRCRLRHAGGHAGRAPRRQPAARGAPARGARALRGAYDVATASLIEIWIDEAERRAWFLFEASRRDKTGA